MLHVYSIPFLLGVAGVPVVDTSLVSDINRSSCRLDHWHKIGQKREMIGIGDMREDVDIFF